MKKLALIFFILSSSSVFASSPGAKSLFEQGTQAYLKADYKSSQDLLTQALNLEPSNPQILTNLGMTQFRLQNFPLAIGLLRKALTLDPDLETARTSLKFVLSQNPIREIAHEKGVYEEIRASVLNPFALSTFLTLSLITFFAAGWLLIRWLALRKIADENELSPPPLPWIPTLLGLGFVIFTLLSLFKYLDLQQIRGTVIESQVVLQMAPGENQAAITEIYGGSELIVRQSQDEWLQVTYPGAFTGWIKKSSLLMTR